LQAVQTRGDLPICVEEHAVSSGASSSPGIQKKCPALSKCQALLAAGGLGPQTGSASREGYSSNEKGHGVGWTKLALLLASSRASFKASW
jgi:hypothetical protein